MLAPDDLLDRRGYTASLRKAAARACRLCEGLTCREAREVNFLRFKDAHEFFIGQDKIHVLPELFLHGLQLFGRARADKDDLCLRLFALNKPRRIDHRRVGHGNIAGLIREQSSCHHPPRRAARGRHEALLSRHLLEKIARFLNCADVRARRDLDHVGETERLHRRDEFRRRHVFAELPGKRRRNNRDDLIALQNRADNLIDLALIDNRAERAVDQTLAARDAEVVVDFRLAVLVQTDRVHPARCLTRALEIGDRVIGTGFGAFAALDAELLVNAALAVYKFHRALRAHPLARRGKTPLAELGHAVLLRRARVAGVGDDVYKRRFIVLLGDRRLVHALGEKRPGLHGLQGKAHRQTYALARNRTLEKYRFPVQRVRARDDPERNVLHLCVVARIRHPRHLGEDLLANVRNQRRNTAHKNLQRKRNTNQNRLSLRVSVMF